jgi:hypothetical protein
MICSELVERRACSPEPEVTTASISTNIESALRRYSVARRMRASVAVSISTAAGRGRVMGVRRRRTKRRTKRRITWGSRWGELARYPWWVPVHGRILACGARWARANGDAAEAMYRRTVKTHRATQGAGCPPSQRLSRSLCRCPAAEASNSPQASDSQQQAIPPNCFPQIARCILFPPSPLVVSFLAPWIPAGGSFEFPSSPLPTSPA